MGPVHADHRSQNRQANFLLSVSCTPQPDCNLQIPGSTRTDGLALISTRPPSSLASVWPGKSLEVRTRPFAPATPSSTIPHGIRAPRDCGRTLHFSRNPLKVRSSVPHQPSYRVRVHGYAISRQDFRFLPHLRPPVRSAGQCGHKILTSSRESFSSTTSTLNSNCPGSVVLTMGYAGSHSTHILVNGLNLNVGSPSACGDPAHPGYTLGCGTGGAAFPAPYSFFYVANISDTGSARYDSSRLKPRPERETWALRPARVYLGPTPSTRVTQTVWVSSPAARPTGHCRAQ